MQVCLSRQRLAAEQDRDWLLVWDYDGRISATYKLGGRPAGSSADTATLTAASFVWYDLNTYAKVALPAGMTAGSYPLDVLDGGPPVVVQVVVPPTRRKVTVQPGNQSLQTVRGLLAAGYLDITLAPGLHEWPDALAAPSNLILRGKGATITHTYQTANYGDTYPLIYLTGDDVTVRDLEFRHDRGGKNVFLFLPSAGRSTVGGLVVADCTLTRANLGFYIGDVFCRDTVFNGGGAVIAPGGLYWRCTFTGGSHPVQDPFQVWAGGRPGAMLGCRFAGTTRGPGFNAGATITDWLFVSTQLSGISLVPGGNELFYSESGGIADPNRAVNRLVAFHTHVDGCDGAVFQNESAASDWWIQDLHVRGGWGLYLGGSIPGTVTQRFTIRDFSLSGGAGIYCGSGCTGIAFSGGGVYGWQPGYGNRDTAAIDLGTGNTLDNVDVKGTAAGYRDVSGFAVTEK